MWEWTHNSRWAPFWSADACYENLVTDFRSSRQTNCVVAGYTEWREHDCAFLWKLMPVSFICLFPLSLAEKQKALSFFRLAVPVLMLCCTCLWQEIKCTQANIWSSGEVRSDHKWPPETSTNAMWGNRVCWRCRIIQYHCWNRVSKTSCDESWYCKFGLTMLHYPYHILMCSSESEQFVSVFIRSNCQPANLTKSPRSKKTGVFILALSSHHQQIAARFCMLTRVDDLPVRSPGLCCGCKAVHHTTGRKWPLKMSP